MKRKLREVNNEKWSLVLGENREMVEEFLDQSIHLSDQTLKQYSSALKIFFYWVYENLSNKKFYNIKSIGYLKFQNWLIKNGLSSSAVRLKRSAISSFNMYVEIYYQNKYPQFRNFITKGIPAPMQNYINKKEPLSLLEYKNLCNDLKEREKWQQLAYLKFSFSSAGRKSEVMQLLKEVISYEPKIKEIEITNENGEPETKISKYYFTNMLRAKGSGKVGSVRHLQFGEDAMNSIKKWIDVRGNDDCPYVFSSIYKGKRRRVSEATFNSWCKSFEPIVGRRVYPHILRSSRASSLVNEKGVDIKSVQKLLGHKDSSTTEIYVIRDDEDASDEVFI